MNQEAVKYLALSIIDLLGGDRKAFELNARLANQLAGKHLCKCGYLLIQGKLKNKHKEVEIEICLKCGNIYKAGEFLRKARGNIC